MAHCAYCQMFRHDAHCDASRLRLPSEWTRWRSSAPWVGIQRHRRGVIGDLGEEEVSSGAVTTRGEGVTVSDFIGMCI